MYWIWSLNIFLPRSSLPSTSTPTRSSPRPLCFWSSTLESMMFLKDSMSCRSPHSQRKMRELGRMRHSRWNMRSMKVTESWRLRREDLGRLL